MDYREYVSPGKVLMVAANDVWFDFFSRGSYCYNLLKISRRLCIFFSHKYHYCNSALSQQTLTFPIWRQRSAQQLLKLIVITVHAIKSIFLCGFSKTVLKSEYIQMDEISWQMVGKSIWNLCSNFSHKTWKRFKDFWRGLGSPNCHHVQGCTFRTNLSHIMRLWQ